MFQWFIRTFFSNLELESQKNKLFLFLLFPLFVLAELNISVNIPLYALSNVSFVLIYFVFYASCIGFFSLGKLQSYFKYYVISGMLLFSMYQLWLFNDYTAVYQIMYINLALALIYLDGFLIMYTGLATALFTALGFIFWKSIFFPQMDVTEANIPIILMLQATVVLWGVTQIGIRFNHFIANNKTMKQLLEENEKQLQLIHQKNQSLAQYAKQVEQLAVLQERNRVARELHDTIGHTLTSMIAGLELLKHSAGSGEPDTRRIDSLLIAGRNGLEEVRDHVHMTDHTEHSDPLPKTIQRLIEDFSGNTGVVVRFLEEGSACELPYRHRLTLLRCVQESLTNAVRHGKADRIRIKLSYGKREVVLVIEDNGEGAHDLVPGYGLKSMRARMEALHGTMEITNGMERGLQIGCRFPLRPNDRAESDIRILLVEDQELIAESFQLLLELEPDLKVIGTAKDGEEAIRECERLLPDIILMDIQMPVMNGIEATRRIKEQWPYIRIVVLTTFQDIDNAAEAISLGAEAYLLKSIQPKHLAETIRMVHAGGSLISMDTAKLLVEGRSLKTSSDLEFEEELTDESPFHPLHGDSDEPAIPLSDKEIEILRLLAEGLKYKEIAQRMHYSEGTVKNYVSTLYAKLSVENRMQAVKKAQELKKIPIS